MTEHTEEFKVGDNVKVEGYCTDSLKDYFGETGDGDYWSASESAKQAKYVGMIGKVTDSLEFTSGGVTFYLVEFANGETYTFDSRNLSGSNEGLTTTAILRSRTKRDSRCLTDTELAMAKELFIESIVRKGVSNQSAKEVEEIAIASCRAALIFNLTQPGEWYTDFLEE